MAQPCRPKPRNSRTPDGFSTGIMAALNTRSVWCGNEDDFAPWSSPTIAGTPPCGAVPAALACLNTSRLRSAPGPLPYQSAKTPRCSAPGNSPTCCVPHTAVAARSSLTPGRKVMRCSARASFARHSAWS